MGKRLGISAIIIAITAFVIFFAPRIFFLGLTELFIVWGLYEFYLMAEKKGIHVSKGWGIGFAMLMPISFCFPAESLIFEIAILSLFLIHFDRTAPRASLINVAVTLFGILYVGWLFSFFAKIKFLEDGAKWVFYTAFVTKMCDAGAYMVGKKWGHHKLISHISPNKTVEGAVAGFVVAVLSSLGSSWYLGEVASPAHLVLLGGLIGILAQLGDLAESLIKRDVGVKDSGALPGLGGILDIVDSLLFTAPLVHYYLTTILQISHA